MNNKFFTVCGIVEIEGKILLVRHTYGTAKDRLLVPGGYVQEGELPSCACEREVLEEAGVTARAAAVFAVQCRPEQWCMAFRMEYLGGMPRSDHYENSEVLLLPVQEAVARGDITNMSRAVLTAYMHDPGNALAKGSYRPESAKPGEYEVFGV